MARLPTKQDLSNLLGILYDSAADPTYWGLFIEQIGRLTRSTSGGILFHDWKNTKGSVSSDWKFDPELVKIYSEYYHALDIWARRGRAYSAGHVCTSQSLCTLREMRTHEIYNDFMTKADIEHGMFAIVERNNSCLASLSLFRDRSRREFDDSDLQLLRFLDPHLRRAFRLHSHVLCLKSQAAGAEAAPDRLPTGIVCLAIGGEIIFMNRSANRTIAEKDGLLTARDRPRAERSDESSLLTRAIHGAASTSCSEGLSAGETIFISRRDRPALQVIVSPIRNSPVQTTRTIAVIVFINDPLSFPRPSQDVMRMLYGLTAAECRVALLLSEGQAPKEIANVIGVTANTVRSQIKSIFCKMGVKRQGDAIRLLLTIANPAASVK